jgi:hypothetical protein
MIVILASRHDHFARDLAARWAAHGAALVTPRDLSARGWRHRLGSPEDSAAVIGGRAVPVRDIGGVVTRLWAVGGHDLPHIFPEDREYVSIEMSAFLTSWLASLECAVLNRPTPTCLAGPNWRPEEWTRRAAILGIPVRPSVRRSRLGDTSAPPPDEQSTTVTVVGARAVGSADEALKGHARRLAAHAGTALLDVYFDGPGPDALFVGASLWPDISSAEVADAMLAHLKGGGEC